MAKKLRKEEDKFFAVGSPEPMPGDSLATCIDCGSVLYYHDNWDWTKYSPICHDCVMERETLTRKNMVFSKDGSEYAKKLLGLTDKELKSKQKEFREAMIAEQKLKRELRKTLRGAS